MQEILPMENEQFNIHQANILLSSCLFNIFLGWKVAAIKHKNWLQAIFEDVVHILHAIVDISASTHITSYEKREKMIEDLPRAWKSYSTYYIYIYMSYAIVIIVYQC